MLRLNKLILPLLVSILLSTVGTLKIGQRLNAFFGIILSPITTPTAIARSLLKDNFQFLTSLPRINEENIDLKKQNSSLMTENQNLKNAITDIQVLKNASEIYATGVPVRVISIGKTITTTSSLSLDSVKQGQPVVSGTILLGFVDRVSPPIVHITPLDSEELSRFAVKTGSGHSGIYIFQDRTPQIVDLPSEDPINLNDTVLTLPSDQIPSNLVIGKVTKVISTPQDPLQKAEIKLESLFSSRTTDLTIITAP